VGEHIDLLVGELLGLLRERGRIALEELLSWGEEHGIHLALTLYMIVSEVSEHDDVEVAPDEELVDPEYNITLPKWIALRGAAEATSGEHGAEAPAEAAGGAADSLLSFLGHTGLTGVKSAGAKPKKARASKRPKERAGRGGGLLAFLIGSGGQVSEPEKRQVEEEAVEEGVASPEEEAGAEEALRELGDLLEDERYLKALRYLSRYWSVGLYRFYRDMERSGVEEPQEIVRTLYRRGLVEIAEPEVINAKPRLRALRGMLRKSPSLAEVFGG